MLLDPPPTTLRRAWGASYPPAPLPSALSERVGRGLTRWALRWFFGAEHRDTQRIPREGPAILVSNHPSILDPFTVAFGTKRWVTWLAFDEALRWPIAGGCSHQMKVRITIQPKRPVRASSRPRRAPTLVPSSR